MGLAASQARFLGLTARKSDKEYQGQQINQARTKLADQTDNLFQELLELKVPTAGAATHILDANGNYVKNADGTYQYANRLDDNGKAIYDPDYKIGGKVAPDLIQLKADGSTIGYEQELLKYSTEYEQTNAKIEILHNQDRSLETRLRAVDSEHNAIQTEMDAVKKVIEKNIEGTFKTFG